MNTNTTPASSRERPSYFEPSKRRTDRETNSTDESGVSPGTVPGEHKHPKSKPPRPAHHVRSSSHRSSDSLTKINIYPIAEALSGHIPQSQRQQKHLSADYSYLAGQVRRPRDGPVGHPGPAPVGDDSSAHSSVGSLIRKTVSHDPGPQSKSSVVDGLPAKRSRVGVDWKRTHSGGVWFARTTSGDNRQPHESLGSSSSASHLLRSSHDVPPLAPIPLRPPLTRNSDSAPGYYHNVKLEKAFTEAVKVSSKSHVSPEAGPVRSPSNQRRVTDSTLRFARKFSLRSKNTLSRVSNGSGETSSRLMSPNRPLTHSTALRQNHTTNVLQRVSSILDSMQSSGKEGQKAVTLEAQNIQLHLSRHLTEKPGLIHRKTEVREACRIVSNRLDSSILPTVIHRSLDPSLTSSLHNMRMGGVPSATPEQHATYKVKRSKSAETEVFFKVDISIRGETSYLPSEARRIHTPPLPGHDLQGKRRGFFFDHNAPREEEERLAQDVIEQEWSVGGVEEKKSQQQEAVDKLCGSELSKGVGTTGWYEARLAYLEQEAALIAGTGEDKKKLKMAMAEVEPRLPEGSAAAVQVDYDIPEHLPSSPLCPKNERYWRYEWGKLKPGEERQRICWMHGLKE